MDINKSIIDQRVRALAQKRLELFPDSFDEEKRVSAAFTLLCVQASLGLEIEEAAELLTDGSGDFNIDAMHVSDPIDIEFTICLFQSKYVRALDKEKNFPQNDVRLTLNSARLIFDPDKEITTNPALLTKLEEVRSLIRDGYYPQIRVFFCNNGLGLTAETEDLIAQENLPQFEWFYTSHNDIIAQMQRPKQVDDKLHLAGKAVVEDFAFRRSLVGRVPVSEIRDLFNRHGDILLERNIRRYLGLHGNRVNEGIKNTLLDDEKRQSFYFFNNGITMVCRKFTHNALQEKDWVVSVKDMQVVNGGQTSHTIRRVLDNAEKKGSGKNWDEASVMLRLYEISEEEGDFFNQVAQATNSQNPVDLADLHSNDEIQKSLEIAAKDLGYTYLRQRDKSVRRGAKVITAKEAAEAVLAVIREKPHQAKFRKQEHFGVLYDNIFSELTAAQMIMSVEVLRKVENAGKNRLFDDVAPAFLPYASHFIAMLFGRLNLSYDGEKLSVQKVTHNSLSRDHEVLIKCDGVFNEFYFISIDLISKALNGLYGVQKITLQQLSATFRRGDLFDYIVAELAKEHG